jgi:hypothetical protein
VLTHAAILTALTELSIELGRRGVLGRQAPTAEYMLAMKVLAARAGIGAERGAAKDIGFLIRLLGLSEAGEVTSIVNRYYDPSRVLPRSIYLVEEILEEIRS